MPTHTYPIIFIFNEEAGLYNAYIPDLAIVADGETMEEAHAMAQGKLTMYFRLCEEHGFDYNQPSPLDQVAEKWKGYKPSLISAVV